MQEYIHAEDVLVSAWKGGKGDESLISLQDALKELSLQFYGLSNQLDIIYGLIDTLAKSQIEFAGKLDNMLQRLQTNTFKN